MWWEGPIRAPAFNKEGGVSWYHLISYRKGLSLWASLLFNNSAVIDLSTGDGRSEFDNSLVVSMEINGIMYQGVLFAQHHPRRIWLSSRHGLEDDLTLRSRSMERHPWWKGPQHNVLLPMHQFVSTNGFFPFPLKSDWLLLSLLGSQCSSASSGPLFLKFLC